MAIDDVEKDAVNDSYQCIIQNFKQKNVENMPEFLSSEEIIDNIRANDPVMYVS